MCVRWNSWAARPGVVVPDNLKSGVKKPNWYEPDTNPSYQEWASHYGVALLPARVRKPKDKAKAEGFDGKVIYRYAGSNDGPVFAAALQKAAPLSGAAK